MLGVGGKTSPPGAGCGIPEESTLGAMDSSSLVSRVFILVEPIFQQFRTKISLIQYQMDGGGSLPEKFGMLLLHLRLASLNLVGSDLNTSVSAFLF